MFASGANKQTVWATWQLLLVCYVGQAGPPKIVSLSAGLSSRSFVKKVRLAFSHTPRICFPEQRAVAVPSHRRHPVPPQKRNRPIQVLSTFRRHRKPRHPVPPKKPPFFCFSIFRRHPVPPLPRRKKTRKKKAFIENPLPGPPHLLLLGGDADVAGPLHGHPHLASDQAPPKKSTLYGPPLK